MSASSLPLPPLTFAQMSAELERAAQQEVFGLEALYLFTLRDPSGVSDSTIAEVKARSSHLAEMSRIFRALVPHERTIRALITARPEAIAS
jgi:hypothetical protein